MSTEKPPRVEYVMANGPVAMRPIFEAFGLLPLDLQKRITDAVANHAIDVQKEVAAQLKVPVGMVTVTPPPITATDTLERTDVYIGNTYSQSIYRSLATYSIAVVGYPKKLARQDLVTILYTHPSVAKN